MTRQCGLRYTYSDKVAPAYHVLSGPVAVKELDEQSRSLDWHTSLKAPYYTSSPSLYATPLLLCTLYLLPRCCFSFARAMLRYCHQ